MGTKINPGKFDCYDAAEPDEPMFVLLGRDKHAPTLIWLWASLRELDGEDPDKVAEARRCVDAMVEWAADHGRKSVGLGQAALVAVMEIMRSLNTAIAALGVAQKNAMTDTEKMRAFLAETELGAAEGEKRR